MGGCCLVSLFLFFGPRIFLIGVLFLTNWYNAFESNVIAFLGWLFFPYTSMAWMLTFFQNGGQVSGLYLVIMIIAVLVDLGVVGSGGHSYRGSSRD